MIIIIKPGKIQIPTQFNSFPLCAYQFQHLSDKSLSICKTWDSAECD